MMNRTIAKIYLGGERLFAKSLAGQAGFTAARFLPMFSERSLCRIARAVNQMPTDKQLRAGDSINRFENQWRATRLGDSLPVQSYYVVSSSMGPGALFTANGLIRSGEASLRFRVPKPE